MNQLVGTVLGSPVIAMIGTLLAIGATAMWLAASWWTYLDMSRRTESEVARLAAVAWLLLSTPALLLLALPVYALVRPQLTVAQRRSRDLVATLGPEVLAPECGACGQIVDSEWRRCPSCATWLEASCPACSRWSAADLDLCPWCGQERRSEPMAQLSAVMGESPEAAQPGSSAPEAGRRPSEPGRRLARLG